MVRNRVVLIVAAAPEVGDLTALIDGVDLIIAADGGLEPLVAVDRWPDLLVGDLDSVHADMLVAAEANDVAIERHRADKDETDLELALEAACAAGATSIVVTGLRGGRADHELTGLLVLGSSRWAECSITADLGDAWLTVVRGSRRITGRRAGLVTLLAIGGDAEGVTSHGLEYPLVDETLLAGSGRGLSNLFESDEATIEVRSGVAYAIVPGAD